MSNHEQPPMVVPPHFQPVSPHPLPLPVMSYEGEMDQGSGLKEYVHILLKRKWCVIITFLSIFLTVVLYTFLRTPIYRASATLQLTQDNPGSSVNAQDSISKFFTAGDSEDKFLQTQYQILQSWSMAERVAKALNLYANPNFKFLREKHPEKTQAEFEAD